MGMEITPEIGLCWIIKAIGVFHHGQVKESYKGGVLPVKNIDLINLMCDVMDKKLVGLMEIKKAIEYVKDRPGHDRRYAIDSTKLLH